MPHRPFPGLEPHSVPSWHSGAGRTCDGCTARECSGAPARAGAAHRDDARTGEEEIIRLAPADESLLGWFRDGHARLVSGPAPALYLMLWNRGTAAGLDVRGDVGVLATWQENMRVRWH
jgi:hypothetical protein